MKEQVADGEVSKPDWQGLKKAETNWERRSQAPKVCNARACFSGNARSWTRNSSQLAFPRPNVHFIMQTTVCIVTHRLPMCCAT